MELHEIKCCDILKNAIALNRRENSAISYYCINYRRIEWRSILGSASPF